VAIALALSMVLLTAELAAGVSVRQRIDQHRAVTDQRLRVALLTFRPAERAGMPNDVTAAELAGGNLVRTVPGRCSALALLAVAPPESGQSWTGINGSPAEPVRTLTVRYAQASSARQAIRQKRLALARCRKVSLIFPPFDEPAQDFSVSGRSRPSNAVGETLRYTLVGGDRRYVFIVRRYVNTLTWSYGDERGATAREEVVVDLTRRLAELGRE
jgi:hypothetical protein